MNIKQFMQKLRKEGNHNHAGAKMAKRAAEHTIGVKPVGYLEVINGRIQVKEPRKAV